MVFQVEEYLWGIPLGEREMKGTTQTYMAHCTTTFILRQLPQYNMLKFIAIVTFAAAAVGTVHATKPHRKRSIENKYITVGVEHDRYLGLSNRKLEGHTGHSMSMDHGEYL